MLYLLYLKKDIITMNSRIFYPVVYFGPCKALQYEHVIKPWPIKNYVYYLFPLIKSRKLKKK